MLIIRVISIPGVSGDRLLRFCPVLGVIAASCLQGIDEELSAGVRP
jgi:hypothetical protein